MEIVFHDFHASRTKHFLPDFPIKYHRKEATKLQIREIRKKIPPALNTIIVSYII